MIISAASRRSPRIAWFLVLAVTGAISNGTSESDGQQVKDEPATVKRAVKVVNLKAFTKLNAGPIFSDTPTNCDYSSYSGFAGAKGFYRAELSSRGWKELKGISSDTPQYFDRVYTRDGFLLRLSAYPRDQDKTGLHLGNYGNIEAAALPRPEGFRLAGSIPISCSGFVEGDFDAAVAGVRRVLQPHDWHEYVLSSDVRSDPRKLCTLHFRRNAIKFEVIIMRHPNGQTMVSYVLLPMSSSDMPLPRDTAGLELRTEIEDGSSHASFQTKLDARQFAEFLRKAASELGWTNRTPEDAQNFLVFEDAVGWRYAASLADAKEGGTRVEFDGVPMPKTPQVAEVPGPRRPGRVKRPDVPKDGEDKQRLEAIESRSPAMGEATDSKELEALGNKRDALAMRRTKAASPSRRPVPPEEPQPAPGPAPEARRSTDAQFAAESFPLPPSAQQKGDTTISGDGLRFPPGAPMPAASPTPTPAPGGALAARDVKGIPVPEASANLTDESSPYRRSLETAVTSPLEAVVAFYRREMPGRGYQEAAGSKVDADQATLVFDGTDSALTATFSRAGTDVKITLVDRHPAAALRDGVAPIAGKARLLFASQSAGDATVTVNGAPYTVKAGTGAKSPAQSLKLDLFPGTNKLVVKIAGKADRPLDVPVAEGETWGVVILEGGEVFGPLRFY